MARKLVSSTNLYNIASAIRAKNGTSNKYTPATMAAAIQALPGGAYNWKGTSVTCIDNSLYNADVLLSSTAYSSWTASTTAKSLKATQSLSTVALDMANYAYLLRWVVTADVAHTSGATTAALPVRAVNIFDQQIMRRPNSLVNIQAKNYNGNVYTNTASLGWLQYYNADGTLTYTWSASYGFYAGVPTPTFSSSTSNTPNLTPKTPILYTRCSTSYFDTARKNDIDTANTKWHIHGELYRMDLEDNCMYQRYSELIDVVNTMLEE